MVVKLFKWFALSILWWGTSFTTIKPSESISSGHKAAIASSSVVYHPFYISVTEINQNTKDKTLEISCKLFAEDFETTLNKDYKSAVDFSDGKNRALIDKLVQDYMHNHLSILVEGKPVKLSYVGFEKDKESAYCYFQVEGVTSFKKLEVVNSLLHDFNDGQINIVHVVVNGRRQSTKLDYPTTRASFTF
ncbi:MAG TPA: DUF6702 family protein [Flavisolibacter sp.]|nr:DUF6702 family protein [Flavisolibacter sp.]